MITICHVSDLHFGRGKDHATDHGRALLHRLYDQYSFATSDNTYLLATGDFANGEEFDWNPEWKSVDDALAPFGQKALVCIGNHDLGLWAISKKYRELCQRLGVPNGKQVRRTLVSGDTRIDTLGIDSTLQLFAVGIIGVGHVASAELVASKTFADAPGDDWKLLYLHHRPVQPEVSVGLLEALDSRDPEHIARHAEELEHLRKHDFLALLNADELLERIDAKVHILAFGHDKDFSTDSGHNQPIWINSNREDTSHAGWIEMRFEASTCTVTAFGAQGSPLSPPQTIAKTLS